MIMALTLERNTNLNDQRQRTKKILEKKRLSSGLLKASDAKSNSEESVCSTGSKGEIFRYDDEVTEINTQNEELLEDVDCESTPVTLLSDNEVLTPVEPLQEQASLHNKYTASIEKINVKLETLLLEPVKEKLLYKCTITRDRKGIDRGSYPTYLLHLDQGQGKKVFLLASKKYKTNIKNNYFISTKPRVLLRNTESCVGNLCSNWLGTQYTLYDGGFWDRKGSHHDSIKTTRQELAAVIYDTNILGLQGPRIMNVILPAMTQEHQRITICPQTKKESLIKLRKRKLMDNIIEFHNKMPDWNDEMKLDVLNFHGRVIQPSIKNFQLVSNIKPEYVVLQFGRVADDLFTMDYRYPLCALQAFAIALTTFE